MQDNQELINTFQDIYDKILFHGVYVKYGICVKRLIVLLKIEDPAELHYVMMHLGRLSCINNRYGRPIWMSERYQQLHGVQANSALEFELENMRAAAFNSSQISSAFINTVLNVQDEFSSHAKVYPIYNENGCVVASLTILTEIMSRKSANQPVQNNKPSSAVGWASY